MALNRWFWPAILILLALAGTLEFQSARLETQTWDEAIHLASGYAYWDRGDFHWNAEHPPLVKLVCALPLRFMRGVSLPAGAARETDQVRLGRDFLYQNGVPAAQILLAARTAAMALNLALAAAFAWWMRRRFGALAALLATALWALDPNVIAHSRYITTDAPIAILFFLTCALWVEYLEEGSRKRLAWAAGAFALATLTKYSSVLLVPALGGLFAVAWLRRPQEFSLARAGRAAAALAGAALAAVALAYWPDTLRCLSGKLPPITDFAPRGTLTCTALRWMGKHLHMPSHAYLRGMAYLAVHNSGGHPSYLLGMTGERGWWYYFPVAFAVKSTMAALSGLALALGAAAWAAWRHRAAGLRQIPLLAWGLLLPPAFYFAFSMSSAINLGLRHLFPVYPFLYAGVAVTLAGWAARPGLARRAALCAMAGVLALQAGECASIAPHYLAFFNAPSGGPGKGPEYLVDSNIDWGQDLGKLARWLQQRHATHVSLHYFGQYAFDTGKLEPWGIPLRAVPGPKDEFGWKFADGCYVAVSATLLQGAYSQLEDIAPLRLRDPVAKIGWSIWVYDLRETQSSGSHAEGSPSRGAQ